jgi:hypothetical protein
MKNILVLYYTQSGQIKDIIDSILLPIERGNDVTIDYELIRPVQDYPFPWKDKFFTCFPESVKGIPCKLKPVSYDTEKDYDLVVFAYQPWYLSPSIPAWSFLESEYAEKLLKDKKVITIIGARNMWICSQEIVARKLKKLKANLVGNIVLTDKSPNYISAITIIRWLIKGNKSSSLLLPEAGVLKKDITEASVFGELICDTLKKNEWEDLQDKLFNARAVEVKYHLLKMERNARKIFNKFAGYILKGSAESQKRKNRIKLFKYYLLFMIFVISPLASLIFKIQRILFYRRTNKKILYYSGADLAQSAQID